MDREEWVDFTFCIVTKNGNGVFAALSSIDESLYPHGKIPLPGSSPVVLVESPVNPTSLFNSAFVRIYRETIRIKDKNIRNLIERRFKILKEATILLNAIHIPYYIEDKMSIFDEQSVNKRSTEEKEKIRKAIKNARCKFAPPYSKSKQYKILSTAQKKVIKFPLLYLRLELAKMLLPFIKLE